jgi:predicted dehydrogenase
MRSVQELRERIRVGVVGCGLVAQAMHLPYLSQLREGFELVALAEPSATVRQTLQARYGVPRGHADYRELLDAGGLDAVVVTSPAGTHAPIVLDALEAGLHVFVEKPLCITLRDVEAIITARDLAGTVVQVGYMKRHDPAFERLLEELPEDASGLRYVNVLCHDPEWRPFFGQEDIVRGADVPPEVIAAGKAAEAEQVEQAVGSAAPDVVFAFSEGYLGSLVHDVNLVHGVLERMREPLPAEVLGGDWWDGGRCVAGTVRLSSGTRWDCVWVQHFDLPEYRELITLIFTDRRRTLSFPSPWLKQSPTLYERSSAADRDALRVERFGGYAESFQRELVHFHECVTEGAACKTPPEQARLDIDVLTRMFVASRGGR